MKRERWQLRLPRLGAAQYLCLAGALLVTMLSPLAAQDIRGVELCTVETRMDRRTGCLQASASWLLSRIDRRSTRTRECGAVHPIIDARSQSNNSMKTLATHGRTIQWVKLLPMRSAPASPQVRNGLKADLANKVTN